MAERDLTLYYFMEHQMIDLASEELLTLREAAKCRPNGRKGRPTHFTTVHRWIKTGVRGVKLEAVRIGGCLFTSNEAIQRFADRLTNGAGDAAPSHPIPSNAGRRRSAN